MHLVPRTVTTIAACCLLAGCADSPLVPAEALPSPASVAALLGDDPGVQLVRPVLDLSNTVDARTIIPLALLMPEAATDVGPGSALLITIPDEGRFGCTANFIWEGRGRRYLGAAGHCFLPEVLTATHGPGADYDASGVVVEVCISGCEAGLQTNVITGTWVRLGKVAYARQASPQGAAVGHDFGVVEVPKKIEAVVRTSMPVWGGPTGVHVMQLGDLACHYGHGVAFGEIFLTKARTGVGGGSDDVSWAGDFAAAFGDSGSGLVACEPIDTTIEGRGAIGVLTHLGVRLNPTTGSHGVVLGTTVARAIAMAREANIKLSLVLQ